MANNTQTSSRYHSTHTQTSWNQSFLSIVIGDFC